jgi:hypothetical protein
VDLAAGHCEVQWAAFAVDDGVDFRRATAAADADRLILLPPFCAAGRTVGFHDRAVDQIQSVARFRCQRVENLLPDAASRPTVEAIVSRRVRAVALRQIAPRLPVRST